MKKRVFLVFCVLVMLCVTATALAAQPGEEVTINLSVTNNNAAVQAIIGFTLDDGLTYISSSGANGFLAPDSQYSGFICMGFSAFSSGNFGSVTVKVDENAAPGTYRVHVSVWDAQDIDGNEVQISVSGGSVTVENKACDHTYDAGVVTKTADCDTEGVMTYTCSKCKATKTEAVPAIGHTYDDGVVSTPATCVDEGVKTYTCATCKGTYTEKIAATEEHTWDSGVVKTPVSCTEKGVTVFTCTVCKETDEATIPAKGHTPSDKAERIEPTCTQEGSISYNCTACSEKVDGEVLPATGHVWNNGTVSTEASCGKEGVKTYTCTNNCGETKTEAIPAIDHKWDNGTVTTEASCGKEGVKTYTCSNNCGETKTEAIPAIGHKWDNGTVTTEASCGKEGVKTYTCTNNCGETKTEAIPALEHVAGEWIVVKEATKKEDGLKELRCVECNELLDSQKIKKSVVYYPNNSACSVGPCFRDESNLTDKWYRFTPIDLSVDGTYVFDLAASNLYIIGEVKVTVADGNVTVECDYASNNIVVDSEFCTFLPSLAETTTLDQNQLKNYPFGEPVSIENDLAGDTKVLLFICNVVDYNSGMRIELLQYKTKAFQLEIEEMKNLMD